MVFPFTKVGLESWNLNYNDYNNTNGRGILNDLRDAEEQAQEPIRRFYQQEAAFELSEVKFIKLFRLNKELVRNLFRP